ncbi:MAG: alginate lyase family protein [Clostridia bacterium]|nr:alginate lyase family protein [Clostridia bacterium]
MELSDIMSREFTDASYLSHQRATHRTRIERAVEDIRRNKDNEAYIERKREEAAYAMQHRFVLPGSGGERMHVGTPPAWHECRTGDEEYLWCLNRMGWFYTLSEMYLLTGEEIYAKGLLSDWLNWIDTCPTYPLPKGGETPEELRELKKPYQLVTPWRTLEVGIRMFDAWNVAYDRLLLSEHMTPEIHTKLVTSFYEHAVALRVMSPIFWPKADHNHYLMEMLGLLQIVCLFPDMREADTWRTYAIHELARCVDQQLTSDGGQVEGSPNYHNVCLSMFFRMAALARAFDFALPDRIIEACRKATLYDLFVVLPNGHMASVGDSAMRRGGADTADWYYTCFGELGPTEAIFAIHPNHDVHIIPEEVQAVARARAAKLSGGDNYQRTLGQYIARTGWRPDDSHFLFICCTPVNNGHAHQDPMSFVLTLRGDPVVVDPSFCTYREGPERRLFKSPEYHSTLTFDDKPPFAYTGMWSYSPQKEGSIRKTYRMGGVYAADASHHNYDPDYHKRLCALVGDDVFIVADDVVNMTKTDVRLYFHMDDPNVRIEGGEAVSERIRVLLPRGLTAEVLPSEKSPRNDIREPSARIRLTDTSHEHALYLTLFTKRDDITDAHIERTTQGVRISYKAAGKTVSFLWSFSCSLTIDA